MDLTDSDGVTGDSPDPARMSNAECARLLEIMLDKVSLDASTCRRHLLDPDFSGVFSPSEAALKAKLRAFRDRLAANDLARNSSGFTAVTKMLQRLGDRDSFAPDR